VTEPHKVKACIGGAPCAKEALARRNKDEANSEHDAGWCGIHVRVRSRLRAGVVCSCALAVSSGAAKPHSAWCGRDLKSASAHHDVQVERCGVQSRTGWEHEVRDQRDTGKTKHGLTWIRAGINACLMPPRLTHEQNHRRCCSSRLQPALVAPRLRPHPLKGGSARRGSNPRCDAWNNDFSWKKRARQQPLPTPS